MGEGSLETETEGNRSPLGPQGPAAAGVLCSVVARAQVGGGDAWAWGKGRGRRERSCPVPEGNCSSAKEQGDAARSLLLLGGLLRDALFLLLLQFFGSAPWFPPWSCGSFPGLGSTLVFAPLWSAPRSLRCWHFAGFLRRLLARPAPTPLLSAVLFLLGGQGLAGLRARLAHLPFSLEQVEERWLGCASSAAGLRCALRAAGSDGAGR